MSVLLQPTGIEKRFGELAVVTAAWMALSRGREKSRPVRAGGGDCFPARFGSCTSGRG
jgi:hypothetical protein